MSESGVYDINVNDYPRHRDETGDKELDEKIDHLDLIINNAVTVSPDCDKGFFEADLDYIANTVNVTSVGAMRGIKAFYPMLKKVMIQP